MSASWSNVQNFYKLYGIKLHKLLKNRSSCYRQRLQRSKHNEGRAQVTSKQYETGLYDRKTEPGEKKDVSGALPTSYSPQYVEATWYDWWVKQGYFTPEGNMSLRGCAGDVKKQFIICLPPPNVTGTLHLGHALTNSIQDAVVRWNRMRGAETLWIPGCDHAGIATQVVVEKKLWREQEVNRHQLGRRKFLEEVWKWKEEKGDTIYEQMKKMGSSLDWSRESFTMNEKLSRAVVEAFVRLHDEGLIYRSDRLVNWSCQLKSTISDIEVENESLSGRCFLPVPGYTDPVEFGVLTTFTYPVHGSTEQSQGQSVAVATTRLETMLGDTAVAVHPDDRRYTALLGKFVHHPFEDRLLPIICDNTVDPNFGTGAVKITPAHDYDDYDIGVRHDLPFISVIDDVGNMENVRGPFLGMKRFDARRAIREALKEKGLFVGDEGHAMVLPICSRSKDVSEPRLKEQWFVDCKQMADRAIEVVKSGELKFSPEFYQKIWFEWLKNVRDWCISRQLWWGHRIPAYKASHLSQDGSAVLWVSGRNEAEARKKAAMKLNIPEDEVMLQQDEDVLDTWFSSGLFPFSVLGWPEQTEDLSRFYPNSLLETGSDIIFFWVARMVMLGQKLTGQLPFSKVLFHGILRDAHGRKMSKSLGNVIDPMDVIHGISLEDLHKQVDSSNLDSTELATAKKAQKQDFPGGIPECGTDALRFSLCSYDFKASEINLDIVYVKSNRHFCNKIWQAFKFVQMNIGEDFQPFRYPELTVDAAQLSKIDKWILSRLSHMVSSCDQHFKSYDLHHATQSIRCFWIQDFCDVYLECVKPVFRSADYSRKNDTKEVLHHSIHTFLRAISPFMPYLAEELFQRLRPREIACDWPESVCIAPYPDPEKYTWYDSILETDVSLMLDVTSKILSIAQEFHLKKGTADVYVKITDGTVRTSHLELLSNIETLSRAKSVTVCSQEVPSGAIVSVIQDGVEVHVPLKGLIKADEELVRLQKKKEKVEINLSKLVKQTHRRKDKEGSASAKIIHQEKVAKLKKELENISKAISAVEDLK